MACSSGERGRAVGKRQRLTPDARRALILDGAVHFISRRGLAGPVRDLAAELGVSVGLVHRYFPTKEALVDAVYKQVFASRVDPRWLALLSDRKRDLSDRLLEFYRAYVRAVDDPEWTRIAMHSGLDGSMLGRKYLDEHVSRIIGTIAREVSAKPSSSPISQREMERAWVLHSAIIYFLIRKHVHGMEGDIDAVVIDAVKIFLHGALRQ